MRQTARVEVARHLNHPCSWRPSFPVVLRDFGAHHLLKPCGLQMTTYSTARLIGGIDETLEVAADCSEALQVRAGTVLVEILPRNVRSGMEASGLSFASKQEIFSSEMLITLSEALKIIFSRSARLASSVGALAFRLHFLSVEDDDYDCSCSFPELPFSIFISCPRGKRPDGALRVAESIIHETMHLQLSLVERVLPLVQDDAVKELYSPWKNEKRHPRGILHGLYVFAVIYRFWASISVHKSGFFKQFALTRCKEIGDQLYSIKGIQTCEDLTAEGRRFVGGIFEQVLIDDEELAGHAPFRLPVQRANEVR